jgi:hypothetical protein
MRMTDSVPTPTQWIIGVTDVRAGFLGGLGLATTLRFSTRGALGEITAAANALGREAVRDQLRSRLAADDSSPLQRYRRVQGEAATTIREAQQLDAGLVRRRAERAEVLVVAAPGFSARVVELDRQIADMEARVVQARQASEAIAATVAEARAEAMKSVAVAAQELHAERYTSLRQRRAAIVAELPAILGTRLTELAGLERALALGSAGGFVGDLDAALDAASTPLPEPAPSPEEASAVSAEALPVEPETPPQIPQQAVGDAQAVETAPEPLSEPGRCQHAKTDGQRCRGRALPGSPFCVLHRRIEVRPAEESSVASAGV